MFFDERCDLCGQCLSKCPYLLLDEEEARVEFARMIHGEETPVISRCVSCLACDEICPTGANPSSLIFRRQEERQEIVRFPIGQKRFEEAASLPSSVERGEPGGPVINLCRVADLIPSLFEGALFQGATFIKGGDYVCRFGYYHIGAPSRVELSLPSLLNKLGRLEMDELVCAHEDCYALFTKRAPELGLKVPFRPVSWVEFLYHRLWTLKHKIVSLNLTAAFQSPCSSHWTSEKESLLADLFALIGIQKPRRNFDGIKSLCCGASVRARDRSLDEKFRRLNLDDARAAGADILVTLCPVCFLTLNPITPDYGLKAIPVSDLCRMALGEISLPAHFKP